MLTEAASLFRDVRFGDGRFVCRCPGSRSPHALIVTERGEQLELSCSKRCPPLELAEAVGMPKKWVYLPSEDVELWQAGEQPRAEPVSRLLAQNYLETSEMPAFDTTGLPGVLQDYVGEVQGVTECDAILPTVSLLCTLSAYAMHRRKLVGYFQDLHPNLWTLTLSASGAFKSTGLRLGTQVLRDLDGELQRKLKFAREREDVEEIRRLAQDVRSLPDSFSWQGLIDRMLEQGGGLFMLSEFSSFLHTIRTTYNEGVKARLTSMYDVVDPLEERTRGNSTIRIENPYLSIAGVSTLEFVRELITPEDIRSGFLTRFLLFVPPSDERKIPSAFPVSQSNCRPSEWQSYRSLESLCRSLLGDSLRQGSVSDFEKKARDAYEEHHRAVYAWVLGQDPALQGQLYGFAKRWTPTMLKIAMLMQLMIDARQLVPGTQAIEAAYRVLLYAMGSTKLLLSGEFGQSPLMSKESKVLAYIAKRGGRCTFRQLMQSRALQGGTKEYGYVVEGLETQGRISVGHAPNQGARMLELVEVKEN